MSISSRLADNPAYMELRRKFAAELPAKVGAIEGAAFRLGESGAGLAQARSLFHLVHRLSGSAAIYGYEEVSEAATAIERLVWPDVTVRLDELPDRSALALLVPDLRKAVEGALQKARKTT